MSPSTSTDKTSEAVKIRHVRSQLFVPGNRPERFDKACNSEADLVCIDFEDAVGDQDKDEARTNTIRWLSETAHTHVSVRINALDTPYAMDDIKALSTSQLNLPFLMIPKVNTKADIEELNLALPLHLGAFFVIIETAQGLLNCADIFSDERVQFAMFGAIDFAADIQSELSWDAHLYARSHIVACAAAHDVTLFDSPHFDVRNLEDCKETTLRAKAIGFHSRSAIHPAQIKPIHTALSPTDAEIVEAKNIIKAYEKADGNVVLLNGKFVEKPVIKKAYRILAFSERQ